jgi:hypothetical protein
MDPDVGKASIHHPYLDGFYNPLVNLGDALSGWWLSHPSEKYESQSRLLFSIIIWKNKNCSKPPTSYDSFANISWFG